MQCPKCKKENLLSAKFCSQCGAPLKRMPAGKKRLSVLWLGGLLLFLMVLAVGAFLYRHLAGTPATPESVVHRIPLAGADDIQRPAAVLAPKTDQQSASQTIQAGRVIIESANNETVSEITAAITGDNIVALPVKSCIGGPQWVCLTGKSLYTITEGAWQEDVPLALWFLDKAPNASNGGDKPSFHRLAAWQPESPVTWHALNQGAPTVQVSPDFIEEVGFFDKCSIPRHINEPGVFIQDGDIVGWSFGPVLAGAYMWDGPTGRDLYANTTVVSFYDQTFAGSREEQLAQARSLPDDTPAATRLAAYARAFYLESRLPEALTPDGLQSGPACEQMAQLAQQLIGAGNPDSVTRSLDATVLQAANSPALFSVAIIATAQRPGGTRSALYLLEDLREEILDGAPGYRQRLDELHLSLYKQLISDAIRDGNAINGSQGLRRARQYFPDDPELHLMEVALMIRENDWAEAENKLSQRAYPAELSHQANMLQAQIKELKSLDGKTAIRFRPGSSYIPVSGRLNGSHTQHFIIDTGASLTTIPSTTAEKLGLTIDDNTPRMRVSTAGKNITCHRLTLDSIEIQGLVAHDLDVLIIDIENSPNVGLLGLNFLNNFDVAIDNEKGIMTLAPNY